VDNFTKKLCSSPSAQSLQLPACSCCWSAVAMGGAFLPPFDASFSVGWVVWHCYNIYFVLFSMEVFWVKSLFNRYSIIDIFSRFVEKENFQASP
jgi:hypothetical protein